MITSFDSLIGMNVRFWAKLLDMLANVLGTKFNNDNKCKASHCRGVWGHAPLEKKEMISTHS